MGTEAKLGRKCPHDTGHKNDQGRTCEITRHCPVTMILHKPLLNTDSTKGKEKQELRKETEKCYLLQRDSVNLEVTKLFLIGKFNLILLWGRKWGSRAY